MIYNNTKDIRMNYEKRLKGILYIAVLALLLIFEQLRILSGLYSYLLKISMYMILIYLFVLRLTDSRPLYRSSSMNQIYIVSVSLASIYILIYFSAGILEGFGNSPYSHEIIMIVINILSLLCYIMLREVIRSKIIYNLKMKNRAIVFSGISFLTATFSFSMSRYIAISNVKELIQFTGEFLLPLFLTSYMLCYLVELLGYKSSVIYCLIIESVIIISPILPNLKWITKGLIGTMFPMSAIMYIEYLKHKIGRFNYRPIRDKENPYVLIITALTSIVIIWFAVGVFPIYPSVIVTGSMKPNIDIGDVIIVKKIEPDIVQVGDIIQFRRDDIDVAHRVIEVINEKNIRLLKTKGDNNNTEDKQLVKPNEIRGIIIFKVPKIGTLKVLMSNDKDINLSDL